MSLAGRRFGPYEIVSPLGAGGMGEVWKARDTRLNRNVAVKILPAALAGDAALKIRLEREAKVISQLNHAHICTLYDIGHDDGIDYLVMELLEGESMADRLGRGALPVEDVLRFGAQIAEGLSAAHRHGVIHRDLKPGNIMLTRAGAKLLDFGLARQSGTVQSQDAPTEARPLTGEGTIVGTVQYMSPEQLQGQPLDGRTDIFALGLVLYEMATGRRAFQGTSTASTMAAILTTQPEPISRIQPITPPALEQVISDCLKKDPNERTESAHDVALQLRSISQRSDAVAMAAPTRRRRWWPWLVAAIFAWALVPLSVVYLRSRVAPAPLTRFAIVAPPGTNTERTAAISPDGRRIVFRATDVEGRIRLFIRSLDSIESKMLPGTEATTFVFFSPDGKEVGFFAAGKMKRINLDDGSVRTIYDGIRTVAGGATWSADGEIVFSAIAEGPLYRIPAAGGQAAVVVDARGVNLWPSFLPDGRRFVFSGVSKEGSGGIYIASLDSPDRKRILPFRSMYDFTPVVYGAGHLFYLRDRRLLAHPFDLRRQELRGEPIVIDEDIEFTGPGRSPLAVAGNGTIVYRKSGASVVSQLVLMDRRGTEIRPVWDSAWYTRARFSADGRRVLFAREDPSPTIWEFDLLRGTATRAASQQDASHPVSTPDSKSIVYSGSLDTPPNVYVQRPDGSNVRLTNAEQQQYVHSVTPDGRFVLYASVSVGTTFDIHALPLTPPHTPIPVRTQPFGEGDPVVSPDGRFLAYVADEGGSYQVYVTTWPAPGAKWQISTGTADEPRWSADGRELYYFDVQKKQLMAVKIEIVDNEVRAGVPEALFPMPTSLYDVDRQGRFLVSRTSLNPNAPPLTVVTGWRGK